MYGLERKKVIHPEMVWEEIFYLMGQLMEERDFNKSMVILNDLGSIVAGGDKGFFWYWDRENHEYWAVTSTVPKRMTIPEGKGIVGDVINREHGRIVNDPYSDEKFFSEWGRQTGYEIHSLLCVPVFDTKGTVIGAYEVLNKLGHVSAFVPTDEKHLQVAANFTGKAMEAHLLHEEELRRDALTKLLNRRGLQLVFDRLVADQYKDFRACTLIMGDIDQFHKINECYGYQAGDSILLHVARILQSKVDINDIVCRYHDDEFVIILVGCDLEQGVKVAERLRDAVEFKSCTYDNQEIHITMSLGVVALDRQAEMTSNLTRVEKKMREAMASGKNCVKN
ncbi:MAG: sensor domain-containing diguanylate cyclase [Lachnospiraceae bacterium]|nr:sensor domain-containing diguanylate cyclase [Lachnospiraceae bacterium]